jgi:hypothetical protein
MPKAYYTRTMCMDVRRGQGVLLPPGRHLANKNSMVFFFLEGKMVSFYCFCKQIVYSATGKFCPLLEKSVETPMGLFVTKAILSNHLDVPRPLKILRELACEVYKPLASDIFKLTEKP